MSTPLRWICNPAVKIKTPISWAATMHSSFTHFIQKLKKNQGYTEQFRKLIALGFLVFSSRSVTPHPQLLCPFVNSCPPLFIVRLTA
jgi:hypothetical protein